MTSFYTLSKNGTEGLIMTHNNFIKFDFEGEKIYGVVRDGRVLAVLQKSGKIQLLDIPIESA